MTTWSKDELRKIAEADDLHISPLREDGLTYGTPTWIWSVAVDDSLYVRGYLKPDDRSTPALRDSQDHAARDQRMMVE